VKRNLNCQTRNIILALIAGALFRSCQATTPPKAYQRVSTPKTAPSSCQLRVQSLAEPNNPNFPSKKVSSQSSENALGLTDFLSRNFVQMPYLIVIPLLSAFCSSSCPPYALRRLPTKSRGSAGVDRYIAHPVYFRSASLQNFRVAIEACNMLAAIRFSKLAFLLDLRTSDSLQVE
jgi:hypothetical protein